jgi:pantoate kinase
LRPGWHFAQDALKVGTPAQLREELAEERVAFEFERMRERDLEVLSGMGVVLSRQTANGVEVRLDAGGPKVADLVSALVADGARIVGVSDPAASLEEAYLAIIGGAQ